MRPLEASSRQDVVNELAVHIGQSIITTLETIGQLFVVEPKQVQNGRVQVMHVHRVLRDIEPQLIGLSVSQA